MLKEVKPWRDEQLLCEALDEHDWHIRTVPAEDVPEPFHRVLTVHRHV